MLNKTEKERLERYEKFWEDLKKRPYGPTKEQIQAFRKLSPEQILEWLEETNHIIYYTTPEEQEKIKEKIWNGEFNPS